MKANIEIFHENYGGFMVHNWQLVLTKGKLEKKFLVEESADEISMSTLLVDEGGKFNNQNLSSALKKACNSLVTKIIEDKK